MQCPDTTSPVPERQMPNFIDREQTGYSHGCHGPNHMGDMVYNSSYQEASAGITANRENYINPNGLLDFQEL